jgi:hypothetical protein
MRILRLLVSRPLPCGCLVGVYETYGGPTVSILDARGDRCPHETHRPGLEVHEGAARAASGFADPRPPTRVTG